MIVLVSHLLLSRKSSEQNQEGIRKVFNFVFAVLSATCMRNSLFVYVSFQSWDDDDPFDPRRFHESP